LHCRLRGNKKRIRQMAMGSILRFLHHSISMDSVNAGVSNRMSVLKLYIMLSRRRMFFFILTQA